MSYDLTEAEKAVNYDTCRHIFEVQRNLLHVCQQLQLRCLTHDQSKLSPLEVATFAEHTPKLKTLTYGSKEYNENLEAMRPALEHHYARNSHHPEHYPRGVDDMTLLDLVEMFCDWTAAARRTKGGTLARSIDIGADRFKIDDQLVQVFHNTVALMPDY